MKRRFDDNALEAATVIFGIKYKPETFKPIPQEKIDKKVTEIYTPEVMEKINKGNKKRNNHYGMARTA